MINRITHIYHHNLFPQKLTKHPKITTQLFTLLLRAPTLPATSLQISRSITSSSTNAKKFVTSTNISNTCRFYYDSQKDIPKAHTTGDSPDISVHYSRLVSPWSWCAYRSANLMTYHTPQSATSPRKLMKLHLRATPAVRSNALRYLVTTSPAVSRHFAGPLVGQFSAARKCILWHL